jgi:hypothetical protein
MQAAAEDGSGQEMKHQTHIEANNRGDLQLIRRGRAEERSPFFPLACNDSEAYGVFPFAVCFPGALLRIVTTSGIGK